MNPKMSHLSMDVFAWLSNVTSSIFIIFLTKWVMSVYKFTFATTICGLHFLSCAAAIRSASSLGFISHVSIPFKHVLLFSAIGSLSIASANLRYNCLLPDLTRMLFEIMLPMRRPHAVKAWGRIPAVAGCMAFPHV